MSISFTDYTGMQKVAGHQNPQDAYNDNFDALDKGLWLELTLAEDVDLGEVVKFDASGEAALAQADSEANSIVVGMCAETGLDGSDRRCYYEGVVEKAGWGLTQGDIYYLDQSTPGAITNSKPGSGYIVEIGIAWSTTELKLALQAYLSTSVTGGMHNTLANLDWSVAAHVIDVDFDPNAGGTLDLGDATNYWSLGYVETMYTDHFKERTGAHGIVLDDNAVVDSEFFTLQNAITGGAGAHADHPVLTLRQTADTAYNIGDIHSGIEFYTDDAGGDFAGVQAYIHCVSLRANGVSFPDAGLDIGTSDGSGGLATSRLTIDQAGLFNFQSNLLTGVAGITLDDGATVGQAAGPLFTFNDTDNLLTLSGIDFWKILEGSGAEGAITPSATDIAVFQRNTSNVHHAHIIIASGTAAGAGIHFGDKDDSDVGSIIYDNANNDMGFTINAAEEMILGAGGILKLDHYAELTGAHGSVFDNPVAINSAGVDVGLAITSTDQACDITLEDNTGGHVRLRASDGEFLLFTENSARRPITTLNDKVGIFKDVPTSTLHVYDGTNDANMHLETAKVNGIAQVVLTNDAQTWAFRNSAGDEFEIFDVTAGNLVRFTIDASGNVDIGENGGSLRINTYLEHHGDPDTYLGFGGDKVTLAAGNRKMIVLTEAGSDTIELDGDLCQVVNGIFQADHIAEYTGAHTSVFDNSVQIIHTANAGLHILADHADVTNKWNIKIENVGAGDAYINMVTGVNWALGVDQSDANKFKICVNDDVSGGSEILTLDGNNKRVGILTASPDHELNVECAVGGTSLNVDLDMYGTGDSDTSRLNIRKSKHDTKGTMAETTDGGEIGGIRFWGVNTASAFDIAAIIKSTQDGNATGTHVPANLQFWTGAAAPALAVIINPDLSTEFVGTIKGDHWAEKTGAHMIVFDDNIFLGSGLHAYFGNANELDITYDGATSRLVASGAMYIGSTALTVGAPTAFDDNVYFTGAGKGLYKGSCHGNHIGLAVANAVQNTWYNLVDADMVSGILNNVVHDGNGKLTATAGGEYLIIYSICFEDNAANDHVEAGIEIDGSGSAEDNGQCHLENKFASEEEHMGTGSLFDIAAGETIEVCIRTTDAGTPDFIIHAINLTIVQTGGT